MRISKILRETGTAVWIGGQLFGTLVLPVAGGVLMRRRDRHRAYVAAWRAWTPIAYGALAAMVAGAILDHEEDHRGLRLSSALLALASTTAGTILGEVLERDLSSPGGSIARNPEGVPVAHLAHRQFLQTGMIPVNLLHGVAAIGLLASAG